MLISRGFGHRMPHRINLLSQASQILFGMEVISCLKINYMSTLFVGIDVSSKTNAVFAMDFEENKYLSSSFGNNQPGADDLVNQIAACMQNHKNLDTLLIVPRIYFCVQRPYFKLPGFQRGPHALQALRLLGKPKGHCQLPQVLYRNGKNRSHRCLSHCRLCKG